MFASNFNFQQKHSTNEPYSNVCRQPLTKNLNPIEHHLLDEEDFSDSYPDQECSHQNEIEGKPSYDVKESKDATLNEHQYEPLVVSRKESCGCKEPAKNADHESSFIRVEDHVVCQDNFIAGNLCHAVNIACKPFTRRAAMQVPRKKFTEFLGTTGKALSVLQANPHPVSKKYEENFKTIAHIFLFLFRTYIRFYQLLSQLMTQMVSCSFRVSTSICPTGQLLKSLCKRNLKLLLQPLKPSLTVTSITWFSWISKSNHSVGLMKLALNWC